MTDELKARVATLLASLGETADEVADALRDKGITGHRDDGTDCPIAHLIAAEIPESAAAGWDDADGYWYVTHGYVRTPAGDVLPPYAVSEFIEVFDNGLPATESLPFERPYWDLEAK
jgi:hypothetical protein